MAPSDPRQTKFVLDESRLPRSWYNIAADLPVPPSPYLHPATLEPIGPGRSRAALPDGPDPPGSLGRARDRDPGASPRRVPALPAEPALPSPSSRARARYPGPHLLQVRGRQPGRQPQAEHGARPGLLQQGRGRQAPRHRDRCRPVGECPGVRRRLLRPRGQGLHGPRQLRPEAVPADPDGDVRGGGRGQPVADDQLRPVGARRDARQPGLARDGDQRGGRGRGDPRRHQVRPGLGAQPRPAAPDGHRPGSDRADGDGRRVAGRRHRLHRRRVELRRD